MKFDGLAFLLALAFVLVFFLGLIRKKNFDKPSFLYSSIKPMKKGVKSWKVHFFSLPKLFYILSLCLLLISFIRPQIYSENDQKPPKKDGESDNLGPEVSIPKEGLALYLLLDRSGSMHERVDITLPGAARKNITRMDYLKWIMKAFVLGEESLGFKGRGQDLLGLVAFARTAHILSPLTFDHSIITNGIENLEAANTPQEGGTAIGYSLFKTVQLISATKHFHGDKKGAKEAFDIRGQAVIMVSDGLNVPNPLDRGHAFRNMELEKAAESAEKEGIRFYLINIEPQILRPEYSTFVQSFEKATSQTGGKFYVVEKPKQLSEFLKEIETIEAQRYLVKGKALLNEEEEGGGKYSEAYFPFLLFGLLFAYTGLFFEFYAFKRIP